MYSLLVPVVLLTFSLVSLPPGNALECYVCSNQSNNAEKCLNTIKTCDYGQEMCLTEIRWGTEPYWSQGADKQYYVSKRCANNETCERAIRKHMPYCTHIWYEDWKCAECCRGDRCNYYVIMGGSSFTSSFTVIASSVLALLFVWHQHFS